MKLSRCRFSRLAAGVLACAVTIVFCVVQTRAQTRSKIATPEAWTHDFTVLTMAPDGAWGAATEAFVGRAIANAIARCKEMSGAELGCGAHFTTIQAGWTLGIRCGRENIVVADQDLAEARRKALRRETSLRTNYVRDMPKCVDVVTVDPGGRVAPARPQIESTADVTTSR